MIYLSAQDGENFSTPEASFCTSISGVALVHYTSSCVRSRWLGLYANVYLHACCFVLAVLMPVSPALAAKRALVRVLLALAALYGVVLSLDREAPDTEVCKAYKRVALKAHPDKGGAVEHAQQLNTAKEAWDQARKTSKTGRPPRTGGQPEEKRHPQPAHLHGPGSTRKDFKVQSVGVLLTYSGVEDLSQWRRFVAHVRLHVSIWKVKYWCATLEATKEGKLHFHLYLQFTTAFNRDRRTFCFETLTPNASCNDLLGEGLCKKKLQESLNRGFFYVWADKLGTQRDEEGRECVEGNYFPAWTQERCTYTVKGQWPSNLWQGYKLGRERYEEYLYACRDGVPYRKRLFEMCVEKDDATSQKAEIEERVRRLRSNKDLYQSFPRVLAVDTWLLVFNEDRLRYPLLILRGPSLSGKTEFAKSLFKQPLELKLGLLDHFPDGMRRFDRKINDGIVLDDLRDFQFLLNHQEKLQGKYDALVEFASTPGGQCAYSKDLYKVPVVVTANLDTRNEDLLVSSDWLSKDANRVLVRWPPV